MFMLCSMSHSPSSLEGGCFSVALPGKKIQNGLEFLLEILVLLNCLRVYNISISECFSIVIHECQILFNFFIVIHECQILFNFFKLLSLFQFSFLTRKVKLKRNIFVREKYYDQWVTFLNLKTWSYYFGTF